MQEPSFVKLAADAAAGLKADREVYRDVTQELQSFLEDTAERFRREGHSDEEGVALAKQAFGSPLEVAAELLNANRRRLKLRAAFRIAFGALLVPLAILLALYVGYGRFARLQAMNEMTRRFTSSDGEAPPSLHFPTVPFFGFEPDAWSQVKGDIHLLVGTPSTAEDIYRYWEAHRDEPDSRSYYAYYAIFVWPPSGATPISADDQRYVAAMRQGERIEPDNALYNVLLAYFYLSRGMTATSERSSSSRELGDEMRDRRAFDLGLAELRKGAAKPYLRTYQTLVVYKKLNALPPPVLTEDYMRQIAFAASELFPHLARYRTLARKIPGCARLLIAEGHPADAEAVMDTWRPYAEMLTRDSDTVLIQTLVAQAVGIIMMKEGADVYAQLGMVGKAQEARTAFERLQTIKEEWRKNANVSSWHESLQQHGSRMTAMLLPVFGGGPTVQELAPGRMHEHVLYEEMFVQVLQILLVLMLLGTLIQGAVWHYRMRRAASVPLLLLPPAREVVRVLWWGLALPMLVYWLYSRLPVVGGREYSFGYMSWRFIPELLVLGIIMLWLPAHLIRRYVCRRCGDLDIALPTRKEELTISLKVKGAFFGGLLFIAGIIVFTRDNSLTVPLYISFTGILLALGLVLAFIHYSGRIRREHALFYGLAAVVIAFSDCYLLITPFFLPFMGAVLALGMLLAVIRYTDTIRRQHGLYYGTLARSLAPVYAFAILFLAMAVQPWLLTREVYWLRKDRVIYSYLADKRSAPAGFTSIEARTTREYSRKLLEVLGEQE